ncbi:hypothetical protein BT67DRAFT_430801 [Trichocladium antarcticum]|uniref:Uncharacterized protein n=1 Tax=Trichocladium antarcticum TaxID=1450529 RepID=A0AAN6ZHV0_9PEZI|nr:hypothetical protein BT67DRAFT_430801 [Trichocladium antarcticum]
MFLGYEVHEVHEYLFGHYVLLGQVIAARKLHHKHFFSLEMDYGHKTYLDRLVSTRRSVLKALENPERRTAELLYEQEKQEAYLDKVWKELLKRTAPVKDEDITELVADITEGYEDESAHLQQSMARAGWLQFSIVAKDCSFPAQLCQLESSHLPLSVLNRTARKMQDDLHPALGKALGLVQRVEGAPSQGNFEKYSGQDKFSHGWCEMDDRVVQRGDLVLVMAEDETGLLKWCTAVTFALQTKPWMRGG